MHPSAYGKRNGLAQQRLLLAGLMLTEALKLDPGLVEGLNVQGRDATIKALREREALADLLEAAVGQIKIQRKGAKNAKEELAPKKGQEKAAAKADEGRIHRKGAKNAKEGAHAVRPNGEGAHAMRPDEGEPPAKTEDGIHREGAKNAKEDLPHGDEAS